MSKKTRKKLRADVHYAKVMEEVKGRLFLVGDFIDNKTTTGSDTTDIEFVCLQLRKIMELVALASIVPNQDKYKEMRDNFEKHYHAKKIFNDLEKINPYFYPEAITREDSPEKGVKHFLKRRESVWLTKKRFLREYEKLGGMLHADNPFVKRWPYTGLYKQYKTLTTNLWELVELHKISLIDSAPMWVVSMGDKGKKVHVYSIEKV